MSIQDRRHAILLTIKQEIYKLTNKTPRCLTCSKLLPTNKDGTLKHKGQVYCKSKTNKCGRDAHYLPFNVRKLRKEGD